MKQLFFVLMAATVLASCKKTEEPYTDPPLTSPGMVAKMDGTPVNFNTPAYVREVGTDGVETISISGVTGDGTHIEVTVSKQGGVGPDEYGEGDARISVTEGTTFYSTNKIVNVNIITIDATHIVGSFIGEANNLTSGGLPKSVTAGKFYVNF